MKKPSTLFAAMLLALLPAAADAAAPEARWMATFEMTQEADWKLPRYTTTSDCFHKFWEEGSGSERWQIKTRRPVKVLAYRLSKQVPVAFKYGTFDRFAMGGDGLFSAGMIVRRQHQAGGSEPGDCGGESEVFAPAKTDCGTRLTEYDVTVGLARGKAYFSTQQKHLGLTPMFKNCNVQWPPDYGVEDGAPAPARYDVGALLSGRRTVVLAGAAKASQVITKNPGSGKLTTRGSISWKLTLKPAGGAAGAGR
ncbi:hypothetical protein VSS74_14680 [Conexibacter stalactiti]|uniref:APCDD1 domain-containing protein n=1 Tax=Conexibacter stalactiti TaxID=1940611 RepID=A0ABU4HQJ7_9ACTN|nr:hypothetical protein [Conexibacter stalactiti]MDW5595592.1 hypothetical protein [Conexibacter stalactiti]MEC5036234.1 hypothetical protein [Conexibacter stalactiti]